MELEETQKSSPESLKSLENNIQIENLDFHETIGKNTENRCFLSSEGHL